MLKVEKLSKRFKDKQVLKDLDLTINEGEVSVIVGRSGEGKTTLLRCINGLEKCDSGDVYINNKAFCTNGNYIEGKDLISVRKELGVVFQNFNLFPHMSILENIIEAPSRVLKISKEKAIEEGENILKSLSLEELKDMYPCSLSGGQKQRVAIGRALAMKPKVICFDEPTSALDPKTTMEVKDIIRDLAKEGIAIMIITHDMEFAKEVSDKIYKLEDGKLKII